MHYESEWNFFFKKKIAHITGYKMEVRPLDQSVVWYLSCPLPLTGELLTKPPVF